MGPVEGKEHEMKIKRIGIDLLKEAKRNPNVMDDQKQLLLRKNLDKRERQPLLVRPVDGGFEIVDGHHRYYAAKELGKKDVPCVVEEMTDAEAMAASLSMNRLRGEVNLGMASEMLTELKGEGWSVDDLAFTGFTLEEIDAPENEHEDDERGNTAEDRPDDEIRTKYRAVPAGLKRHRKYEGDHCVHRDRHWNDQDRHDRNCAVENADLALTAGPSEGEHGVD